MANPFTKVGVKTILGQIHPDTLITMDGQNHLISLLKHVLDRLGKFKTRDELIDSIRKVIVDIDGQENQLRVNMLAEIRKIPNNSPVL